MGGGNKPKQSLEGTVAIEKLLRNAGNLWNMLQFFIDNQVIIKNFITTRLETIKRPEWYITHFVKLVKYNVNKDVFYVDLIFRYVNFTCINMLQIKQQIVETS